MLTSSFSPSADYPFAAEVGLAKAVADERDPYDALDDLMAVVEELCPECPTRDLFRGDGDFRL